MEANEARQMEMLLEQGGIADDGMNRDPVSGNEVPPGSMAKEVRDDVPAQLSEGEYVVPADVTRFYGVKFFEDLRAEAKRGLMNMEQNGRIGGEPVDATMANSGGNALTPEEMAALEQLSSGMAQGGSVQSPDPYAQQQQMYQPQQNAPSAVGNTGYSPGGVLYANEGTDVSPTIDPNVPQFDQQSMLSFGPGFLVDQTLGTSDIMTVTLYGPDGDVQMVTLPAQQEVYDELLAAGYTTDPTATSTATSVGKETAATGGGDGGSSSAIVFDDEGKLSNPLFDVSRIEPGDLKTAAGRMNTLWGTSLLLGNALGGPVAAALNTGITAKYNDIIDRMEEEGIDHDFERKGSVFGGEGSLYEGLKDTDGNKGATFGDTWLGDLLGFDEDGAGVQGDSLKDSFKGSRRNTTTSSPASTNTGGGRNGSNSYSPTSSGSLGRTTSSANTRAGETGSSQVASTVNNAGTANQNVFGGTQAEQDYVTSAAAGAEGGLMDKKALNRKANKKK